MRAQRNANPPIVPPVIAPIGFLEGLEVGLGEVLGVTWPIVGEVEVLVEGAVFVERGADVGVKCTPV
jgi:hypothetical protein